jgi:ABC-type transport system involved in multi-copper enzyme maturation permease subunit
MNLRASWLIARTVLLEAVRRREIYVLVLASCLLIGLVLAVDFFNLKGFTKFYRETALQVMGVSTALMVIVLAARQLPREFSQRTLYPLLARPLSRFDFLLGKLLGVMGSAVFGLAIFMAVFVLGTLYFEGTVPWGLLWQHIFLQVLMLLVLACLSFLLSTLLNLDAAITLGVLFYATAAMMMNLTTFLHANANTLGRAIIQLLTWGLPQLALFDLSEKVTHAAQWTPLPAGLLAGLAAYSMVYAGLYFGLTLLVFRRKSL